MNRSDFDYIELDNQDQTCIRLNVEPFKDMVYKYGTIHLVEPVGPSGEVKLAFDYEILSTVYTKEELMNFKPKLEALINEILQFTLSWSVQHGKLDFKP